MHTKKANIIITAMIIPSVLLTLIELYVAHNNIGI